MDVSGDEWKKRSSMGKWESNAHLVSDDEDILLSLELHDDRLEADDDVSVGLATWVSVSKQC